MLIHVLIEGAQDSDRDANPTLTVHGDLGLLRALLAAMTGLANCDCSPRPVKRLAETAAESGEVRR